ncbi:hypothetical protein QUF80_07605 [Desulfococcaceae bacterium HSG8]|nr:hypothetical protein [Desulfococcaceae bacterium HSG8]
MSWIKHHSKSEEYASHAEIAARHGDEIGAAKLYHRAAREELADLNCLDINKKRTIGITAISAASLFFKGQDFKQTERIACQWLADSHLLPSFATGQLQTVLRTIRDKRASQDSDFKEERLTGILRGLHLDDDWLEVNVFEENNELIRIYQTGDVIDDMIGPMVNHRVTVDVWVKPDGKRLFRDIQSDEPCRLS